MATAWCGRQKHGVCWAQPLLLEPRSALRHYYETSVVWPTEPCSTKPGSHVHTKKLSMKRTRTQHGVVQYVNLQIARQFQYVPDPASPQRCQLAHPQLPAMTCENAVPNQQGQSFKGKQGNCRQVAHMNLTGNSAMCVPILAIRAWTCGTALAKWVVLGTEPCSAKPCSHGLKNVL